MWDEEDPKERFWARLIRERAMEFMRCPEYMKKLRFNYEQAKSDQKLFGKVWEEYGTNVFQLIAEAHGETWDAEDEEKNDVAINQREPDDDLAGAREESSFERVDQLQGKPEASLCVVEEEQGLRSGILRSAAEEATPAEESGRRRGSFYRLAGGSG